MSVCLRIYRVDPRQREGRAVVAMADSVGILWINTCKVPVFPKIILSLRKWKSQHNGGDEPDAVAAYEKVANQSQTWM